VRAVFDGSGALEASYLAGFRFGEVLAEGVGERYALRDRLGSTVGWMDASGAVDALVLRDAYGVRAEPTAAVVPFGYTGHAEDPTGLVWGRARYLATGQGSCLHEDGQQAQRRYTYASAAPMLLIDSSGFASEDGTLYAVQTVFRTSSGEVVRNTSVVVGREAAERPWLAKMGEMVAKGMLPCIVKIAGTGMR
jgi:RHS repeat-associated protein